MSNYAIVAQKKIRGAKAFNGLVSHNSRELFSKNIDRSRTHKNITLMPFAYKDYADFADSKREEIRIANIRRREKREKLARFPRPQKQKDKEGKVVSVDAALMQEFSISLSPDALLDAEQREQYLRDAFHFFSNRFQQCEILYGEIHKDETTEHLHIGVSYFDKTDKRFIQKELSKQGLTDLDKIRDDFQREVAEKYGLIKQDGSVTKGKYDGNKADIKKGKIREEERKKQLTGKKIKTKAFGTVKETWEMRARRQNKKIENLEEQVKSLQEQKQEVKIVEKIVKVPVIPKEIEEELRSLKKLVELYKKTITEQQQKIKQLKAQLRAIPAKVAAAVSNLFKKTKIEDKTITSAIDNQQQQQPQQPTIKSIL